jgi:hypothetical protein
MMRNCDSCGTAYMAQRSTSRFCSSRCRRRNAGATAPPRPPAPLVIEDSALIDATRAELQAVGRIDTWQGQALLLLAEAMCTTQTAAALAALSREFLRARAAALQDSPAAGDPVDELKRRRARKHGPR